MVECEFLWGADQIGAAIGRNCRQAFHLLSNGDIKCAKTELAQERGATRNPPPAHHTS